MFLGSVRSALARAEGEPARLTAAAISAGVAFITLAVAAHVLGTSISWTSEAFDENFQVDPNTARLTLGLSFGFFAAALSAAGAMAVAVSMLAFESRAFPTWLAGFGAAAAIAGIATFFCPSRSSSSSGSCSSASTCSGRSGLRERLSRPSR